MRRVRVSRELFAAGLLLAAGCQGNNTRDGVSKVASVATTVTAPLSIVTGSGPDTFPDSETFPRILPHALNARALLAAVPVENEHQGGYKRDLFGGEWIEQPDCLNTRNEVLARDSETEAIRTGCSVTAGSWLSPYDVVQQNDPAALQIDHLVPLKEAWDSGAWAWTGNQRLAFANDLRYRHALIAVTSAVNTSKGDRDPSNWLPPLDAARCKYVAWYTAQKWRWALSMDQSEWGRINNVMATCTQSDLATE